MNKAVKKLWIEKLRSGEFTQSRCALKRLNPICGPINLAADLNPSYCCLGVLCEITKDIHHLDWKISNSFLSEESMSDCGDCGSTTGYLPGVFRDFDELFIPHSEQKKLVTLNDEAQYDFSQIANYIEANIETID